MTAQFLRLGGLPGLPCQVGPWLLNTDEGETDRQSWAEVTGNKENRERKGREQHANKWKELGMRRCRTFQLS